MNKNELNLVLYDNKNDISEFFWFVSLKRDFPDKFGGFGTDFPNEQKVKTITGKDDLVILEGFPNAIDIGLPMLFVIIIFLLNLFQVILYKQIKK